MVRAAILGQDGFAVSDYEIRQKQKSYTYKTLEYFCREFPGNEYYFIIGEDSLQSFSTWRYPEKICARAKILVAIRQDAGSFDVGSLRREIEENYRKFGQRLQMLRTQNFPISSTQIRQNLYQDETVEERLPKEVYDYIRNHGLYKMKKEYDIKSMEQTLKKELTNERYRHTQGVMYTAAALAMRYLYPVSEAMAAGLLHDCAKCVSDEKKLSICKKNDLTVSEIERRHPQLLHAKVGAHLARKEYGITDQAVLHAIEVHTTGCAEMSLLDQIIFVSDYIEPGRAKAPRLADIRQEAFMDLNRCCAMILQDTMEYLSGSEKAMDQTTAEAFDYYRQYL